MLVVEDDSRLNGLIRAALGEEGYATDSAADGDEASYLVSINPYDVIVLDLGLPKRDGLVALPGVAVGGQPGGDPHPHRAGRCDGSRGGAR